MHNVKTAALKSEKDKQMVTAHFNSNYTHNTNLLAYLI